MMMLFLELKLMMTIMNTNRLELFEVLLIAAPLSIGVNVVFVFGFGVGVVVVLGVPLQNETSQWDFSFKVL
jgi:hypothetical protein